MSATVQAPGSVLVGVDGSAHNTSAVAWAAAEALSSSATLVLVHDDGGAGGAAARATLDRAAAEALQVDRDLRVVARVATDAGPAAGLVRSAREEQLRADDEDGSVGTEPVVVVGRRGGGGFREMTLGSTARRLAHQPDGPVTVIVPSGWDPSDVGQDAPVVVEAVSDHALAFATARAVRLGRGLVAVSSWSVPADEAMAGLPIPQVWSVHADRAEQKLEETLRPWRAAYPGLEVVAVATDRHPVAALLDQGTGAELLVVPRGTTAAAVVEHTECPVAVV